MSQTDYLMSLNLHLDPGALDAEPFRQFYLRHGLDAHTTGKVVTQGHGYLKMLSGLPPTFIRLIAGEKLKIGRREFSVLSGGGHAPEQLMFYCGPENLFLSADQVLAFISPNVSVWAVDPKAIRWRSTCARSTACEPRCRGTRWCCPGISCRSTACTPASPSSSSITKSAASPSSRRAAVRRGPAPRSCLSCFADRSTRTR